MNQLQAWLTQNPVLANELRLRMRGKRAFLILAGYLLLLSALVFLVYFTVYQETQSFGRYGYAGNFQRALEASSTAGRAIFYGTSLLLLLFVSIIAPAFTAGSLVGERERQTYDLLTMTTLSARAIVWGKLSAIMTFNALLIMATLPILTMAYFFGGVTIGEILITVLVLLMTALVFSSVGLFVSSFARSTTTANLTTYGVVVPLLLGVPFLVFILGILSSGLFFDDFLTNNPPWLLAAALTYIFAFFLSINPLSMAVTSEIFFWETNSYFYAVEHFFDHDFFIIAPWVIYLVFGLAFSYLLFVLTVKRVAKVS